MLSQNLFSVCILRLFNYYDTFLPGLLGFFFTAIKSRNLIRGEDKFSQYFVFSTKDTLFNISKVPIYS